MTKRICGVWVMWQYQDSASWYEDQCIRTVGHPAVHESPQGLQWLGERGTRYYVPGSRKRAWKAHRALDAHRTPKVTR